MTVERPKRQLIRRGFCPISEEKEREGHNVYIHPKSSPHKTTKKLRTQKQ